MLESQADDVAGTKVFLVGSTDLLIPLADRLSAAQLDVEIFQDPAVARRAGRPHVVVVHLKSNGREALEEMQAYFHTARFLVVGAISSEQELLNDFGRGIHGWILDWEPIETTASAILLVCRGAAALSLPVLEIFQRKARESRDFGLALSTRRSLTTRQAEILDLVGRGHSDQEIAELLTLSVRTVQRHVQDVFQKLGVHSREDALRAVLNESPPATSGLS
jgi:DNA-binding NarL/FixJ family response regulator